MKNFLAILTFSIVLVLSNHAMEPETHECIITVNSVGGSDPYYAPLFTIHHRNEDRPVFHCKEVLEKLYVATCGLTTALSTIAVIKTAQTNTDITNSSLYSLGVVTTLTAGGILWYYSNRYLRPGWSRLSTLYNNFGRENNDETEEE